MTLTFSASILPVFATTAVVVFVGNGICLSTLTWGYYTLYRSNKLTEYLFTVESGGGGILVRTSLDEALLCIGILVSFFAIFSAVLYWRIRKREV